MWISSFEGADYQSVMNSCTTEAPPRRNKPLHEGVSAFPHSADFLAKTGLVVFKMYKPFCLISPKTKACGAPKGKIAFPCYTT